MTTTVERPPVNKYYKEPSWTTQLRSRASSQLRAHRATLITLGLLLLAGGLVQGIGMYRAPQRIDDEGTYVAQAWAVFHLHALTHYTYWYDHPPLGWLQLAGYAQVTGAFDRAPYAVAAGREFMLVVQLISMVLLWLLARRIGLPRWGSAVAVGLFALSPLAVQFHRTVYLDNIATPWLLGAFVLGLTPRRRLTAFAGAGLCFAIAVLSKETSLVVFPVFAWVLWRNSAGTTRRYAITVASTVFVLAGSFFVLFALLKGEVLPGANRTSLTDGILYQLADRASSGSVFRAGTLGHATVSQWLQLDVVLPLLAGPAALLGLFVRRLRPFAVLFLLLVALVLRPGYLPVPFVIVMLPFAALLVAGVAVAAWSSSLVVLRVRLLAVLTVLVALAAGAVAVPAWATQERGFALSDPDQPMVEATDWMRTNLPRDQRVLLDDSLWVDLVDSGFPRQNVVWFYKPDTDPAVPTGWQSYDWVVSTKSVRDFPLGPGTVSDALRNSEPVATFGKGDGLVQIRRVDHAGVDNVAAKKAQTQLDDTQREASQALVGNPSLRLAAPAKAALQEGDIDPRLLTVIAAAAATRTLGVADLPVVFGEDGSQRRTLVISTIDGDPVTPAAATTRALIQQFSDQNQTYRAQVQVIGKGADARLIATFPPAG